MSLRGKTLEELEERERRLLNGLRRLYFELERREIERQVGVRKGKIETEQATPETGLARSDC